MLKILRELIKFTAEALLGEHLGTEVTEIHIHPTIVVDGDLDLDFHTVGEAMAAGAQRFLQNMDPGTLQ